MTWVLIEYPHNTLVCTNTTFISTSNQLGYCHSAFLTNLYYLCFIPENAPEHPEGNQHRSFNWDSEHYFQILRVFYRQRPRPEPRDYVSLNYVTITPVQLQPGPPTQVDFETMRQTMIRLQAWLKAAGSYIYIPYHIDIEYLIFSSFFFDFPCLA